MMAPARWCKRRCSARAGRHLTTGVLEGGGIALFELLAR